jgi:hypothetical protein
MNELLEALDVACGVGGNIMEQKITAIQAEYFLLNLFFLMSLCCTVSLYRVGVIFQIDGCHSNEH